MGRNNWSYYQFSEIFTDVSRFGTKLPTREYLPRGKYPIVDQGKDEIVGYTNRETGLYKDTPILVFGDHTRIIKYVDYPFFLGADGVKLLKCTRHDVDYKYLYYCLKHLHIPDTGYNRHFKYLKEQVVPLPPLPEQRRIAAVLDQVSSLIALRKAQLAKLDLLVKARFVEMFGTENEFSMWQCGTVADVANVFVGVVIKPAQYYTDKRNGIPAFRSQNIGCMKVKDNDWVYFTEEGHLKNKKTIINENDVLVVRSGTPGIACVASAKCSGYNAVDIIIVRPHQNQINPVFLAMFTNMPHGRNQIKEKTGGAAQQHLNIRSYESMKIIRPPLNLQNQFSAFVKQTNRSECEIQHGLIHLETLKKSLMQEYFG